MCGIAGFVGDGSPETLRKMGQTLIHRGPDDEGVFFIPGEAGLHFRRLAIIDLSSGNQPVTDGEGSAVSVFNGEIYNYRALRAELSAKGHVFRSSGDAEVIPRLYAEEGPAFVSRLNGMFAIALWDRKKKRLFLARDRFGKKPLYYSLTGDGVVFGSEVKALLKHPKVRRELNFPALSLYLTHEYVPSPHTLHKGIFKLRPGHFAVFENGAFREEAYYDAVYRAPEKGLSLDEAVRGLDGILEAAVADRLVSDVPLGAFLSGGLDSSGICSYMSRLSAKPVKTFSIAFAETSFDESAQAREVARHLGTEHHEKTLNAEAMADLIPELADRLDEPTGDAAVFPNYVLSRFAREKVTVALGGDGGDEIFMGYPTFQAHKIASWYATLPEFLRRGVIEPAIRRMPADFGYISLDYRLKRFISAPDLPPHRRDLVWIGSWTPDEKLSLLTPEASAESGTGDDFDVVDALQKNVEGQPLLNRIAYQYVKTYMADDILFIKDRSSMYASLELRAPFLDYRVVDYVNALPEAMKLKGLKVKHILKRLMTGRLPAGIVNRKKKGFGVPVALWLKGRLSGLVDEAFSEKRLRADGLFRYDTVRRMVEEHRRGAKDHRKPLWTLLMFQLWKERWA